MKHAAAREPDGPLPRVTGVEKEELDRDGQVAGVYARSCGPLIGLLTVMGGSATDAEEIAQDAFVKLLEHWEKVCHYEQVDAWLRTVAVRMLISRHRRRQVATLGLRRLGARPDEAAGVLLHHVHDLPVDEVATLLRVPPGTVKSRLSRARAALAPLLADDEKNERTSR